MFCWPSRGKSAKAKLKIKNLGNVAAGKKSNHHHHHHNLHNLQNGTFKCDLSEALLASEEKCSSQIFNNTNNSGSGGGGGGGGGDILLLYNDQRDEEDFNFKSLWGKDISEYLEKNNQHLQQKQPQQQQQPPQQQPIIDLITDSSPPQSPSPLLNSLQHKNNINNNNNNNSSKLQNSNDSTTTNTTTTTTTIKHDNNHCCHTVPGTQDRTQRMGPDGGNKLVESTGANPPVITTESDNSRPPSEGRVPSHIVQSHHHHHHHHNSSSHSQNVVVSQTAIKQPNNNNTTAASSANLIPAATVPDPVNPSSNNNNVPSSPCTNNNNSNNGGASRLKEELTLQFELNANLKTKLEEASSTFSKEKCEMEAELKVLSQKFIAMTIIAHNFDVQRSILEKKLADERATGQGRENQLATERLEEIQNLRVEFERERECIGEELQVMRKKDEAQVEQLKELGAELSKKEENLRTITQEYENGTAELKRKHQEELEAIRIKYREEAQEEVKYQVLKRTLSSPTQQTNNSPNDVLQKEIHSLQVVIDMRNVEIRQLGQEILTQKSFSEDLVNCKEQNKGLLAKVEDLKAQLAKSRQDKHEVQEKYQVVESQADHAIHQLAQLQLENEQLKWRLQSIRTDERVNEIMSKSAVQLGCDKHVMNLDYESAMSSLLDPGLRIEPTPNGCVK